MTQQYAHALQQALVEGLIRVEQTVTQPLGLTYDLRAARTTLQDALGFVGEEAEGAVGGRPHRRPPVKLTPMQAVENLAVTQRTLDILAGMGAVERPWADRTRRVLARAEQRLSTDARKERVARVRGLYVILDPTAAKGRDLVKLAEAVLKGDARMLQLRDKQLEKGLQLPIAKRLTELCEEHKALLIVNDHADLAAASGAHGVHVGQKDLPVPETRKQLAADQLVGNSNATVEEAMLAQQQGVDYAAVGAMFPSPSKDNTRPAGIATLAKVKEQAQVPLVAIGGITEKNVAEVVAAGADAISVISAVLGAPNPGQAAKRLSEKIEKALAKRG